MRLGRKKIIDGASKAVREMRQVQWLCMAMERGGVQMG